MHIQIRVMVSSRHQPWWYENTIAIYHSMVTREITMTTKKFAASIRATYCTCEWSTLASDYTIPAYQSMVEYQMIHFIVVDGLLHVVHLFVHFKHNVKYAK